MSSPEAIDGAPSLVDWDYDLNAWPEAQTFLTRGNAADAYPRALTPFSQDLVVIFEEEGIRDFYFNRLGALREGDAPRPLMNCLYGLVYLDVEELGVIGDRMPGTTRREIYQQLFGLKVDPAWDESGQASRLAELAGTLRFAPRVLKMTRRLPGEIEALLAEIEATRPQVGAGAIDERGALAWLERLDGLQVRCWSTLPVGSALASAYYGDCVKRLTAIAGDRGPELTNRLHVGIGGNETAEVGVAIRELAARVRAQPRLRACLGEDPGFAGVIARFGYRAAAELELSNPSWREDPAPLLEAIEREVARNGSAPEDHRGIREHAERELDALPGGGKRGLRSALARSRRMMPMRENAKLPICLLFDEYRRLLGAAGALLTARGALAAPQDAHYLRHRELHAALAGGAGPGLEQISARAAAHRRCLELELPEIVEAGPGSLVEATDAFYKDRGLLPPPEPRAGERDLEGIGASAGVVTGIARVLDDPAGEFEAGDVLVTSTVDPGWTPLLVCAGAIVLDSGGEMSHGATVARELGVPCVVNLKHGSAVIPVGARVEVDGGRGTVRIL